MFRVPTEWLAEQYAEQGAEQIEYRLRKPRILEAYNVARNEMINSEDRKFKYFVFEFPVITAANGEDIGGLDNSILSPGTRNGKINPEVIPVQYKVTVKNQETGQLQDHIQFRVDICWDICIVETVPRSEKTAPETNELQGGLAKGFGGLYVSHPAAP